MDKTGLANWFDITRTLQIDLFFNYPNWLIKFCPSKQQTTT